MERRDFLVDLSRLSALCAVVPNVWRVTHRPRFVDDPFTLGVASGDPTATGGVLWTRLATRPFEPDGGMEGRPVVTWELAADDRFATIVQQGRATAAPELGYSVHVNVDGLTPDHWYWYRFHVGEATSPVGRFRTAPADGALTPLAFAVASCQRWDQGLWTAYEHMAREELDLVTHLGDYIYEARAPRMPCANISGSRFAPSMITVAATPSTNPIRPCNARTNGARGSSRGTIMNSTTTTPVS